MSFLVEIVLVLDLADDLLQYIFNGDQACGATVFVDDNRHMITGFLEFLKQLV